MSHLISRRDMLRTAAVAAGVWTTAGSWTQAQSISPNEKLNIAGIGIGGRGAADVHGIAHENIVALCDVDEKQGGKTFAQYPQAKRYKDFRKLLDEMHGQIDAVVVGTPDHTHAVAGVMAMKLGKHCYCEKPLAHSVYETRIMAEAARDKQLVTQMGTQIHEGQNYRRAVELVKSGAIGPVREVHVWLGANFQGPPKPADSAQPELPTDRPPLPATLDWDLWLGPAAERPYHPAYAPFGWRNGGTSPTVNWAISFATTATWRSGRSTCGIPRLSRPKDRFIPRVLLVGQSLARSIRLVVICRPLP